MNSGVEVAEVVVVLETRYRHLQRGEVAVADQLGSTTVHFLQEQPYLLGDGVVVHPLAKPRCQVLAVHEHPVVNLTHAAASWVIQKLGIFFRPLVLYQVHNCAGAQALPDKLSLHRLPASYPHYR